MPKLFDFSRIHFCYSSEKIRNLIIQAYDLIVDNDHIVLSTLNEFSNLPKHTYKIIFSDDLLNVSDYIFSTQSNFKAELYKKHTLIVYIGSQIELLNSYSYNMAWNNILYIDPKSNNFEEKLKFFILFINSTNYGSGDFTYQAIEYLVNKKGISVLNEISISKEQNTLEEAFRDIYKYITNQSVLAIMVDEMAFLSHGLNELIDNEVIEKYDGFESYATLILQPSYNLSKTFQIISFITSSYNE